MKKDVYSGLFCFALLLSPGIVGAAIALPSAVPVDVFGASKGAGFGTIKMNVLLDLKDDPEGLAGAGVTELETGQVNFEVEGLIYSRNVSDGSRFRYSFTIGQVQGALKNNQFAGKLGTYNNTYDQSGFFLGYIPAYSGDLFRSRGGSVDIKYAYTLNTMLYYLTGDYSIDLNSGAVSYAYDENTFGIAFKPTVYVQPTWFVTRDIALTVYGGATVFMEMNINSYENKQNVDDAAVVQDANSTGVKPAYGYDISIRGIFGPDDVLNVSSIFSSNSGGAEGLSEVVVMYKLPF